MRQGALPCCLDRSAKGGYFLWRAFLGLEVPSEAHYINSRALGPTQAVSSRRRAWDQDTGVLSPGSVPDVLCNLEQIVSLGVHSFDHLYKRGGLAEEVLRTQGACVLTEGECEPCEAQTKAQLSRKRLECCCSVLEAPSATAPPTPAQAPCGGGLGSSAGSPGPDNRRCQCSS